MGVVRSHLVVAAICTSTLLAAPTVAQDAAPAEAEITYTSRAFEFEDVDVARVVRWLGRAGLRLPVELEGQASGRLTAEIPWGALLDSRAWRLGGSLTSPRFLVNEYELEDVRLELRYRDGVLRLEELRVGVPAIIESLGKGIVIGTASMEVQPRGRLTASVEANALPLESLLRSFEELRPVAGILSGNLTAEVEVNRLRELSAWSVSGPVRLDQLSVRQLPIANVSVQLGLRDAEVTAREFDMRVGPVALTGKGRMGLLDEQRWNVDATLAADELAQLFNLLQRIVPQAAIAAAAEQVTGRRVKGTAHLAGALAGQVERVAGHISIDDAIVRLPQQIARKSAAMGQVDVDYNFPKQNALELKNIVVTVLGGEVTGSLNLALGDACGASGSLNLHAIDLGDLASLFGGPPDALRGVTSGSVTLNIPAGALNLRGKWLGSATLTVDSINMYSWELRDLAPIEVKLENGLLKIPPFFGKLDGEPIEGALTLEITPPWDFTSQLDLRQFRVDRLGEIPQFAAFKGRLGGRVNFTADLQGTLDPVQLTGNGAAEATELSLDAHKVNELGFQYRLTPELLALSEVGANLYGGNLTGSMSLALTPTGTNAISVDWRKIDAGTILDELLDFPVELVGTSDGSANLSFAADQWISPAMWTGTAKARLEELRANGISIASVDAQLVQRNEQLDYSVSGTLFDGAFEIDGTRDRQRSASGFAALGDGTLNLRGASIAKATQTLWGRSAPGDTFTGTFTVELSAEAIDDDWRWEGSVRLTDIHRGDPEISTGATISLDGDHESFQIRRIMGELAGGQMTSTSAWNVGRRGARAPHVRIRAADSKRLAELLGIFSDSKLTGSIDVDLQIQPAETWQFNGSLGMGRGEFYEAEFRNARVPISLAWNPSTGRMRLFLSSGSAAFAGGRIAGRLTGRFDYGWALDGKYRFYQVDLSTLVQQLGSDSSYGSGRLTGMLDISGRNVRSVEQLHATLRADLKNTRAMDLPVLEQMRRFVPGAGFSNATQFEDGRLEARLTRGVIELERLSLASNQLRVYVTGRINLTGRLRLEAVLSTGQLANPALGEALLSQIVSVPAAPVALLKSANDFLSNRVIYLDVYGTVNHPILRPRPFRSLPQEVVRFFLQQFTGGLASGASAAATAESPN